jgi:hypothetical protein
MFPISVYGSFLQSLIDRGDVKIACRVLKSLLKTHPEPLAEALTSEGFPAPLFEADAETSLRLISAVDDWQRSRLLENDSLPNVLSWSLQDLQKLVALVPEVRQVLHTTRDLGKVKHLVERVETSAVLYPLLVEAGRKADAKRLCASYKEPGAREKQTGDSREEIEQALSELKSKLEEARSTLDKNEIVEELVARAAAAKQADLALKAAKKLTKAYRYQVGLRVTTCFLPEDPRGAIDAFDYLVGERTLNWFGRVAVPLWAAIAQSEAG